MKEFANIVSLLSGSTKTNDKLKALEDYFRTAEDRDKVWVIALFSGRRPRRTISGNLLRTWCCEFANIPAWLFDECYHTVGDLSETIALLTGQKNNHQPAIERPLHFYINEFIRLEKGSEEEKKQFMVTTWRELQSVAERFVFNKLLSGVFRIGVSQQLIVNAISRVTGLESPVVAHRISGNWDPNGISFGELLTVEPGTADSSKPYPFYLAYPLEGELSLLGDPSSWQAEWKWDGIRGQLIRRNNELFVWSRGEELMTDRFPEYRQLESLLPDGTVLDGEIIVAREGQPLPFSLLQTRIGRKNLSKKLMEDAPVSFFAYDLLEYNYEDWRPHPLMERRKKLEEIIATVNNQLLQLSPVVHFTDWDELSQLRQQSRENNAEGFMLKRRDSPYQVGRKRGDWWKWKIEPLGIDGVLIYAQKGSGRRSNLYTDYTFAVLDGDKLVPFAKAYSGLTDKEIAEVDAFVKRNAIEKFGPVRTVKPELVFELAFEGIAASKRHRSGVALRFPRINRWRKDKKVPEINTLDDLKKMLEVYGK